MYWLWSGGYCDIKGIEGFFLIALSHNSLANYYQLNAVLTYYHKYTLTELEDMTPWEREVYMKFIMRFIKNEEEAQERAKK